MWTSDLLDRKDSSKVLDSILKLYFAVFCKIFWNKLGRTLLLDLNYTYNEFILFYRFFIDFFYEMRVSFWQFAFQNSKKIFVDYLMFFYMF